MHTAAGPLVTCPDCAAHHRPSEPACPFCRERAARAAPSPARSRSLVERLGLGLMHTATAIGLTTTMVACYGGPPYDLPPECTDSSQCGANEQCDDYGQCIPADVESCRADYDCSAGETCTMGYHSASNQWLYMCVTSGCSGDLDCADHETCAPATSTCEPDPLSCDGDFDCALGVSCVPDPASGRDRCVGTPATPPECMLDADCDFGERCVTGECIEPEPVPTPAPCASDAECAAGEVCAAGQCSVVTTPGSCTADVDCVAPAQCIEGACVEPSPVTPRAPGMCVLDRECGPGGACIDGMCHLACADDASCTRTEACVEGLCTAAPQGGGECLVGTDCASDAVCVNGFCAPRCTDETAATVCSAGELCDHGLCRPDWRPLPECHVTADCATGLTCIDAQCRAACWGDGDCPRSDQVCSEGFCATPHELAPACTRSADCAEGLTCRNGSCE